MTTISTYVKPIFYTALLLTLIGCRTISTTDQRCEESPHDIEASTVWEKITNNNSNKQLYKAILVDTTTIITNRMFGSCDSLGTISIPNSVKVIGQGAFAKSQLVERYKEIVKYK